MCGDQCGESGYWGFTKKKGQGVKDQNLRREILSTSQLLKLIFFLQFSGTIALHLGHVKCNQGRVMDVWNGHYQDNALMVHFFSPLGT